MQDKSTVLLDVRTAQEYTRGHIKGARLFSLDRIHTYEGKKDKSIYLTGDGEDIQIELLEGNENT